MIFLNELRKAMGTRRFPDAGIMSLFNPKNPERKALRAAWAALRLGPPTLKDVRAVLLNNVGKGFAVGRSRYTLVLEPLRSVGGKQVWVFRENAPEGDAREELLRGLRLKIAGLGPLRGRDIVALFDQDLEDWAYLVTRRENPISQRSIVTLLRALMYYPVDGFVLVRTTAKRWTFAGCRKKKF